MKNRIPKVGLVKNKRASGNYYRVRYKLPGHKNYTYENVGYTSKHQAELAQAQRQSDFINGKFNLNQSEKEVVSLGQLIDEFYTTRPDLFITTLKKYKSYSSRFQEYISEYFPHAHNDITNIKSIYIIEFLRRARLKEYYVHTWSDKNCNGARALLQMIFDYAVSHRYLDENPVKEIRPFSIPERTTGKVIPDKDLKVIFKNLPKNWLDPFKFLLNTGLRNSELTNLTWSNFHSIKKGKKTTYYIEVVSSSEFLTKTRKSRKIPLNTEALKIIKGRSGVHDKFVFTTSFNEKIAAHRLLKVLNTAQKELSTHFRVHDFRHTFGSKLAIKNVSLYKISELMGHSIQETTRLYAHLQSEDLKDAVELIDFS